jgi:hypothetical protein
MITRMALFFSIYLLRFFLSVTSGIKLIEMTAKNIQDKKIRRKFIAVKGNCKIIY